MLQVSVGKRIKQLRIEKGLSQEEFAFNCGLDRTYITSVERGRRNISLATLEKIVKALDISYSDFFNFKES